MLLSCTTCGGCQPISNGVSATNECNRCRFLRILGDAIAIATIFVLLTCFWIRSSISPRAWPLILGLVFLINGSINLLKAQYRVKPGYPSWLAQLLSIGTVVGGICLIASSWLRTLVLR